MRTVPLAGVLDELPKGTATVSPQERRELIYRRRQHVLRRYHLY
jgi:hypothetical protein